MRRCYHPIILIYLTVLLLAASCSQPVPVIRTEDMDSFQYPTKKVWAHKCNDTVKAHYWKERYPGLEVDVIYSSYQNELFVGHDLYDTILGLKLSTWFGAIDHPEEICYWLDVKNLDTNNAATISEQIIQLGKRHNTLSHLFIENQDAKALRIVHQKGLHVLYWAQELHGKSKKTKMQWMERIARDVRLCHPIGISCSHEFYPILNEAFPNINIHYWNTPVTDFEANKKKTERMSQVENIKVILVDYE